MVSRKRCIAAADERREESSEFWRRVSSDTPVLTVAGDRAFGFMQSSIIGFFEEDLMAWAYKPLSQDCHTRVLELYPAIDTSAPLCGEFRDVNLNIDPFYDAISYTWGEPNFTERIIIDEDFFLCITPNMYDALMRFRHPTEIRSIWADSICINQKDDEEKAKQIPLMTEIYRCASSVLVWMGKHQKEEARLRKIAILSQKKKSIETAKSDMAEIISALTELVSLRWFSRRWVIQEVVLNPNVTFYGGMASVLWLRIAQLLNLVPQKYSSSAISHLRTMKTMWDVHTGMSSPAHDKSPRPALGILDLMFTFSDTECADGRDRIYALAGLASDVNFGNNETKQKGNKIVLRVDYTKSVESLYRDFAVAIKQTGNHDNIRRLLLAATERSNGCGMNESYSWVPDWRLPILRSRLPEDDFPELLFWGNCLPTDIMVWNQRAWHGEVQSVLTPFPTNASRPVQLNWVHDVFTSIKYQIEHLNKGWRYNGLNKNWVGQGLDPPDEECEMSVVETWVLWYILTSLLKAEGYRDARISTRSQENYVKEIDASNFRCTMANRRLFAALAPPMLIHNRYLRWLWIGIGPSHMSAGDIFYTPLSLELSLYQDCSSILILRQTKELEVDASRPSNSCNPWTYRQRSSLIGFGFMLTPNLELEPEKLFECRLILV
ncbi:hypothetical protein O1611_g7531 [Lasiodiplodia mahajangana]|uniref:Uncharacterized protein n=1 Tax=Lasiodiplodia mahajangana TaxID=1108764 RepID=A0ACC2JFD8_9PEZI|nr:hypothetical protein O1611_g7531 [Lasiodiplodia mahajangana]